MTLDEARQIICNQTSPCPLQVEAAAVMAYSRQTELSELIRCLRLGGLPAEIAATSLYSRTGRPYSGKVAEFSIDADEWKRYLARQLELAAG